MMDERFDAVLHHKPGSSDGERWTYKTADGEPGEVKGSCATEAAIAMAHVLAAEIDAEKLRIKTVTAWKERAWRFETRLVAVEE